MTITDGKDQLPQGPRTPQDRMICEAAAGLVTRAEIAQKHIHGHVFKFAKQFLTMMVEVGTEQREAEILDRAPEPKVKPIVTLGNSPEDVETDSGIQRLLERHSQRTATAVIDCVQKGKEFATEITSYGMYLGGIAVEVLRTKSGTDPDEPIVYTLNTIDTTADVSS